MKRAFTLIELMIVIAVIGVLAAIIFPSLQITRARAQAMQCVANLRSLGSALNLYLADNKMMMPALAMARTSKSDDVQVIDNTLSQYVSDQRAFACPADNKGYAQNSGTSYDWNSALDGQSALNMNFLQLATTPGKIPVMGDKEGWHKYRDTKVNFLYADGHADQDLPFSTTP